MAFDFSREFNKLYSQDASALLGGIHQIEQQKEKACGFCTCQYRQDEASGNHEGKGYHAAPQMMQQQRSPSFGEKLLGAITPALGSAVKYGVGRLFNSGSSGSSGLNLDAVQSYMTPSDPYSIPSSSVTSSSGLNLGGVASYMDY